MLRLGFALLVVLCGASGASVGGGMINQLVDEMIYELTVNMTGGTVQLPPLDTTYDFKVEGIRVSGSVKLENGSLSDLRTLARAGDAKYVNINESTSYLAINLTLATAKLENENYELTLGKHIRESGAVDASVGSNEVDVRFTLSYDSDGNCKSTLNYITLKKLDDFSIKLDSSKLIKKIKSKIITWALNKFSSKIRNAANDEIAKVIASSAADLDVCKYLPF